MARRRRSRGGTDNYLCPAFGPVREDAAAFVRKALGEWGFDGLKIDGQHLNGAPPCFNPAHAHAAPEDAVEGVPGFFKAIWDAAQSTKPGALVEICPCGTGLLVLHDAVSQHDGGLRSGELLAGAPQGQDAEGAASATASPISATTWR